MSYLNLTRTNGTDLVNPVTALNNNWDQIDSKFKAMDSGASAIGTGVVSPQQTLEVTSSGTSPVGVAVHDGSTFRSINSVESWGAWTTLTLQANYNPVTGKTPQIRVSSLGRVQLRGAIQYLTGTTAWLSGYNVVNDAQLVASSYAPSQTCVMNTVATPTGTTTWAYGQCFVSNAAGFLKMWLMYRGTALASGNYISLESIGWFIN